ncbi:winged helix-turn-helix transcriptional regulator [Romboutsia maritimum]|uniref:Winged helix-turn-helix transcriptional regulator n=1 Tax=Romboutsia maritimum TaxID=2020948 RepID=A0A371IX13_9FIRM|nr:NTP transferase domain-containing protein [Romboutsia maritimum]RDY25009.1 winged helix-turn-helix transcriptional regulator [Romboutsia maritimum]
MGREFEILYLLNNNEKITQRMLASKAGISIGGINSIIKNLETKGYIETKKESSKSIYLLTDSGLNLLSEQIQNEQLKKINLHQEISEKKQIKQAVILAAGEKKEFGKPIGFLQIHDMKIIDRLMSLLNDHGIEKVVIVVGYESSYYEEYAKNNNNIKLVKNDRYKWTGTMQSLSLAKDFIDDDFLLLENDLIFEERAIKEILKSRDRDCMVITSESGSGDEALVEIRDGYVYRMSKDMHQFNKIDGEMIGISKISYEVFNKMIEQFKDNKNPYLNYEYTLMDIGREYKIGYIKIDDLVWSEIDTISHYKKVVSKIYNKLLRKEQEIKITNIKSKLKEILDIDEGDIKEISPAGGMTNKNYKVNIKDQYYILRMPGNGTENMISRINEKYNSQLANKLGLDTDILYSDEHTGIKISKFIDNAETLNETSAKREENMELTANILKKLHDSGISFKNEFNVFDEIEKYEKLLQDVNGCNFSDYYEVKEKVVRLDSVLNTLGRELKACHNDTVPENFVKGNNDRIYLIDWEYSGMNDPMWDIAAHIIECNFSKDEEKLFLQKYFKIDEEIEANYEKRILIYKICQDFLWSIWSNLKEAEGDDFGTYGIDRYNRAKSNLLKLEEMMRESLCLV